jgi:hypothetical protein
LESLPKLLGDSPVTADAEGPDIRKVALTAAFDDRKDVVRIPQGRALPRPHAPHGPGGAPPLTAESFQPPQFSHAINAADGTDSVIALEYLLAQVCGAAA